MKREAQAVCYLSEIPENSRVQMPENTLLHLKVKGHITAHWSHDKISILNVDLETCTIRSNLLQLLKLT